MPVQNIMLRYLTAGESHGKSLAAIMEGVAAGLPLAACDIDRELERRQRGYGRGARQKIEKDRVEITSGVRFGVTTGSPITLAVQNLDWENWKDRMSVEKGRAEPVTSPRPGHADLSGAMKYLTRDIRNILERSSARETAARVAVGAVAKRMLKEFGISIYSWVVEIGGVKTGGLLKDERTLFELAEKSVLRSPDSKAEKKMKSVIDLASEKGDSVGGIFEVVATGVPPGLGSHTQWDRKLNGRLAMALMSIQAIKGVEVGAGFRMSALTGSKVHDEIFYGKKGAKSRFWPVNPRFFRTTNNAGGIEGGISNGEPIVLRAVMKPIPTLRKPLRSVDMITKKPFAATVERSDVCAVPAASVVGEAVVAFELASAFLEKFGGDSVGEIKRNYRAYLKCLKGF